MSIRNVRTSVWCLALCSTVVGHAQEGGFYSISSEFYDHEYVGAGPYLLYGCQGSDWGLLNFRPGWGPCIPLDTSGRLTMQAVWVIDTPQAKFENPDLPTSGITALMTSSDSPYGTNRTDTAVFAYRYPEDFFYYLTIDPAEKTWYERFVVALALDGLVLDTDTINDALRIQCSIDSGATWLDITQHPDTDLFIDTARTDLDQNWFSSHGIFNQMLNGIPLSGSYVQDAISDSPIWAFLDLSLWTHHAYGPGQDLFELPFPDRFLVRFIFRSDSLDSGRDGILVQSVGLFTMRAWYSTPLSISPTERSDKPCVFPDPGGSSVTISWPGAQWFEASFIDQYGRTVLRFPASGSDAPFDVGSLPAGAYVIRLVASSSSSASTLRWHKVQD